MGAMALHRESDSALDLSHPQGVVAARRFATIMVGGQVTMMMTDILVKKVTMRTTLEGGG